MQNNNLPSSSEDEIDGIDIQPSTQLKTPAATAIKTSITSVTNISTTTALNKPLRLVTCASRKYATKLSLSKPKARNQTVNPYKLNRLVRQRQHDMAQRHVPVQQTATQQPSISSKENKDSIEGRNQPTRNVQRTAPPLRITRSPSYLRYLATGIMDESFGDLRNNISLNPAAMQRITMNRPANLQVCNLTNTPYKAGNKYENNTNK